MAYPSRTERAARERRARRARIRRRRRRALGSLLLGIALAVVATIMLSGSSGGGPRQVDNPRSAPSAPDPTGARGAVAREEALGNARIRELAQLGLPVYCGGPRGNAVAFTFDDGPGPYTHYAIKKLSQAGERATFFVVGRSMDNFPGWLVREQPVAVIGDHTYTHPQLTALSSSEVASQLQQTKQKIERVSSQPVDLFRPPYGARDAAVDSIAKSLGMLEIIWNVDSRDSAGANWAQIISNVEAGLKPGAIILMHENRGQTIRALTTLLPELRRRRLRSVSVPQLFAIDPPSDAQVREGRAGCASSGSSSRSAS